MALSLTRDRLFAACLLLLCAVLYRESRVIPDPMYEPLGPAFLPTLVLGLLGLCALLLLLRSLRSQPATTAEGTGPTPRRRTATVAVALTFVYVAALESVLPGYRLATGLYLNCRYSSLEMKKSIMWKRKLHFEITQLFCSIITLRSSINFS